METDRDRNVTRQYPALLAKNLCRGKRGNVRAVELVDVTDDVPENAVVRRKKARIVVAYARDLGGDWYAQIARGFIGNVVTLVAVAPFPGLKFQEGDDAAEEAMGLAPDDIRALIRRRAPDCVPAHLRGTPLLREA